MFSPIIIAGGPDNTEIITPSDNILKIAPFENKKAMEHAHLRHFQESVKKKFPQYSFSDFQEGADPPDFEIKRGGITSGLELTMYTLGERREQIKFFAKIQEQVKQLVESKAIDSLEGVRIHLSFGELGGKPNKVKDEVLQELMDAFIQLTHRPKGPMPKDLNFKKAPYPVGEEGQVGNGAIHWMVTGLSNMPLRGSALANATGFELSYTQAFPTSRKEIIAQLQACIDAKDKPGADELLISAGAPDTNGWQIFAESECLIICMKSWKGLDKAPKHLKRIFLDIWGSESVFIIHDALKEDINTK
ncbi:hypothetical protein [Herbaspirillum aquaticum]|jgi:hypothetical protein|uniref:hypothetical protein n=1 Tax=Herbaspirillum aquaticum TaxID=568783 RepID=UPI0024DE476E|nr:hypothetical protein [Herbaspirillum aquaticum]